MTSQCVTGGNSGIGLALCKQLAAEDGCFVLMGSRSVERGEEAKKSLGEEVQALIEVVQCDITDPDSIAAAAAHTKQRLPAPLYALVNNAGCGLAHGVPAAEALASPLASSTPKSWLALEQASLQRKALWRSATACGKM